MNEAKRRGLFSRANEKISLFDRDVPLTQYFKGNIVIDVGSSTGGFTKFALDRGAKEVIAVEIGTKQMDPLLAMSHAVKLYEKTDIMDVGREGKMYKISVQGASTAVMDVSFVSCRDILLHLRDNVLEPKSCIILLFKPQFEAKESQLNKGIIKNSKIRREVIKYFEDWLRLNKFVVVAKRDSGLAGSKGNVERFYVLRTT